jgi:CRP-like cAMP-binding protein
MSRPELPAEDNERNDTLQWLHTEGRRFAAQGPDFDVEQTLAAVRRRAASFWESLSLGEQHEFAIRATTRTFPAAARLMEAGETADHVLVILDGWATISVQGADGTEQVIAERGAGELVGESAIQRGGLRSATVVARTEVQVLAMKAENFDEFLRTHPSVPRPQSRPT